MTIIHDNPTDAIKCINALRAAQRQFSFTVANGLYVIVCTD